MIIAILYLLAGYKYAKDNYVAIELTVLALRQDVEGIEDVPDSLLIMITSGVVMLAWLPLLVDELLNRRS
jgi:hypothetical protein